MTVWSMCSLCLCVYVCLVFFLFCKTSVVACAISWLSSTNFCSARAVLSLFCSFYSHFIRSWYKHLCRKFCYTFHMNRFDAFMVFFHTFFFVFIFYASWCLNLVFPFVPLCFSNVCDNIRIRAKHTKKKKKSIVSQLNAAKSGVFLAISGHKCCQFHRIPSFWILSEIFA